MSSTTRRVLVIGMCLLVGVGLSMLQGCGSIPTTIQFGDNSRVVQKTVVTTQTKIKSTRHSSSKKPAPKTIADLVVEGNHGK